MELSEEEIEALRERFLVEEPKSQLGEAFRDLFETYDLLYAGYQVLSEHCALIEAENAVLRASFKRTLMTEIEWDEARADEYLSQLHGLNRAGIDSVRDIAQQLIVDIELRLQDMRKALE